eukprot:GHVQ01015901.1.p1 GENE.GHVQ01015901.1~~GHVQ01015901.1.p1  ORF type:complete len:162 (+),score=10.54 GHVQ01015901.1:410-895(+)
MPSIKEEVAFEKRTAEAHRIRAKYPNRVPVICEKAPRSDLPEIDKKKFLVPMNMLVGEFKYIIHKHINQCAQIHGMPVTHEKTIYLFVNNTAPKAGALIQEVYESHMNDDGFLYIEYSCENTLGNVGTVITESARDSLIKERFVCLQDDREPFFRYRGNIQ